jgi:hypothetical protein
MIHNKQKRRTPMPLAGFERAIPAIEWLQTYALHGMDTVCMKQDIAINSYKLCPLTFEQVILSHSQIISLCFIVSLVPGTGLCIGLCVKRQKLQSVNNYRRGSFECRVITGRVLCVVVKCCTCCREIPSLSSDRNTGCNE